MPANTGRATEFFRSAPLACGLLFPCGARCVIPCSYCCLFQAAIDWYALEYGKKVNSIEVLSCFERSSMHAERVPFHLITVATAAIVFAACRQEQPKPAPQSPEVGVVTVQPTPVPVVSELPGRTSALLAAQVRARVDGIVLYQEFVEGTMVKAGEPLYRIDPAPYVAALNSAKASLAHARASGQTSLSVFSDGQALINRPSLPLCVRSSLVFLIFLRDSKLDSSMFSRNARFWLAQGFRSGPGAGRDPRPWCQDTFKVAAPS